jgi:hypothetical protein
MPLRRLLLVLLLLAISSFAATKPHVITFGKWMTVKWNVGANETDVVELKVRPLYVDGHPREYILGAPHEITERLFVARRAFRINDDLPGETSAAPHWIWQRGGWITVDRATGRISQIDFPGFDSYQSAGAWYRDYFAYCSVEDKEVGGKEGKEVGSKENDNNKKDTKKIFSVVAELGRRKPILKQSLGEIPDDSAPDSACTLPNWQRQPARVTFQSQSGQKISFTVRGSFAGEGVVSRENDRDENDADDAN